MSEAQRPELTGDLTGDLPDFELASARRRRGQGAVFRRRDGRWEAQLRLPGAARRSFYGHTRQACTAKLEEARWALEHGLPLRTREQTVGEYLEVWLGLTERRVRRRTLDSYELNVRRLLPYLGSVRLPRLTPALIQNAYDRLLASGLSRYSIVQVHGVLAPALEHAFRWGLISRNPAVWVSVPRPQPREMTALTAEQLRQLFESSRRSQWYPLWVLLGTAGLRISEALGLFWTDIDLGARRLQVRRALQRQRGRGLVFVEPKTPTSRRSVCLTALGSSALFEHRQSQEATGDRCIWHEEDLVFPDRHGGRLDSGNVNRALAIALDEAGLPQIRVHDLRHTAASVLLVSGVHPKAVQELLGHSTVTTTLNTYSHLTPLLHQEAVSKLDEVLSA